jgi:hypothetical protein
MWLILSLSDTLANNLLYYLGKWDRLLNIQNETKFMCKLSTARFLIKKKIENIVQHMSCDV